LRLDADLFFDVFCHDVAVEEIDDAMTVLGIADRGGHHDNCGPTFIELVQQLDNRDSLINTSMPQQGSKGPLGLRTNQPLERR